MRINSQLNVGVHALVLVAFYSEDRITSEKVALSIGCNPVIVRNVYSKLSKAGLLKTGMGMARTELGRPADEITLCDVLMAVEDYDVDSMFRMYPVNRCCPIGSEVHDLLSDNFARARDALMEELSKTTIADLVGQLPAERNRLPPSLREEL